MIYLLFFVVALCASVAVYAYCSYEGVLTPAWDKFPRKKQLGEEFAPFTKRVSLIMVPAILLVMLLAQLSLYKNTQTVSFIKLFVLLVIVISAGIVDLKKKIIPNLLVCFGLLFWVCITAYDISKEENLKGLLESELIGLAIGFGLLAVVSLVTKGAIGFGDVKLFGVIGLIGGAFCTYSTLLVSLIISVIVAAIGLIAKKISKKDTIPFGPCIALGYLVVLFLSSY